MEQLNWNKSQKIEIARMVLRSTGHVFKHPTLLLEGRDGWFVILTPRRPPHQAVFHVDRENKMDFFAATPELLE